MSAETFAALGPDLPTHSGVTVSAEPDPSAGTDPNAGPDPSAAAEARNDRFLREIVESWQSCPYAQQCRDGGRLWRAVSWTQPADVEQDRAAAQVLAQIAALETSAATAAAEGKAPEVALLVFPGLASLSSAAFDKLHLQVRAGYEACWPSPRFYVVAFHPEYPADDRTPHTLVRFFRRSPDPTLQFVERRILAELRRGGDEAERVRLAAELIAAGADAEELARRLKPARDPSARVTARNAETFAAHGERLRANVDALVADARAERAMLATTASARLAAARDTAWHVVDQRVASKA